MNRRRPDVRLAGVLASCMLAALSALGPAGCTSSDRLVPEPVVHTPLDVDPMEDIEIQEWWVGETRLIHLRPDGVYTVHQRRNQYTPPLERGRWDRTAYLVIRLAPYEPLSAFPTELRLARHEGALYAGRPGGELLRAANEAPVMIEDQLVGRWQSDIGVLDLRPDLTFELHPRRDLPPATRPRAFMREHGTWIFSADHLILHRVTPDEHVRALRVKDLVPLDAERDAEDPAMPWITIDEQRYERVPAEIASIESGPR